MFRIAWYPAIRMIKLTTVATTGRLMKRSVKFIRRGLLPLTVRRSRRQFALGLDLVIYNYAQTALEPKHARCHNFFTRFQPGSHRNHVAFRLTKFDKLFSHPFVLLPLLILH